MVHNVTIIGQNSKLDIITTQYYVYNFQLDRIDFTCKMHWSLRSASYHEQNITVWREIQSQK